MDENTHSDHTHPPSNPEIDDSGNPTEAAPRAPAGREMLVQLQQMIDTMATQAGPVMREVAAKAAELAAIAGEKAGPLAHRAAGVTESVGQRVAARSKDFAADLRRPKPGDAEAAGETADGSEMSSDQGTADWPSEPPRNADD
jgi:hypothetical protein